MGHVEALWPIIGLQQAHLPDSSRGNTCLTAAGATPTWPLQGQHLQDSYSFGFRSLDDLEPGYWMGTAHIDGGNHLVPPWDEPMCIACCFKASCGGWGLGSFPWGPNKDGTCHAHAHGGTATPFLSDVWKSVRTVAASVCHHLTVLTQQTGLLTCCRRVLFAMTNHVPGITS